MAGTKYPNGEPIFGADGEHLPPSIPIRKMLNQGCARCTKIIEGEKIKFGRFVYCEECIEFVKARDKENK